MHILAHVDRHIVADHMGYVANIDASGYKIRTNKAEQRLQSQVLSRGNEGLNKLTCVSSGF